MRVAFTTRRASLERLACLTARVHCGTAFLDDASPAPLLTPPSLSDSFISTLVPDTLYFTPFPTPA